VIDGVNGQKSSWRTFLPGRENPYPARICEASCPGDRAGSGFQTIEESVEVAQQIARDRLGRTEQSLAPGSLAANDRARSGSLINTKEKSFPETCGGDA
jgi:hypothetical protein